MAWIEGSETHNAKPPRQEAWRAVLSIIPAPEKGRALQVIFREEGRIIRRRAEVLTGQVPYFTDTYKKGNVEIGEAHYLLVEGMKVHFSEERDKYGGIALPLVEWTPIFSGTVIVKKNQFGELFLQNFQEEDE